MLAAQGGEVARREREEGGLQGGRKTLALVATPARAVFQTCEPPRPQNMTRERRARRVGLVRTTRRPLRAWWDETADRRKMETEKYGDSIESTCISDTSGSGKIRTGWDKTLQTISRRERVQ